MGEGLLFQGEAVMSRHGERLSASDIRNRCACMMLPESARVVVTRPRIRVSGADFRSAFLVSFET